MQDVGVSSRRKAYVGIILMGIVSLLGDIVYEGSRGLIPDYLKFLGATALVVGLVGGLGDLIGYAMRLVSGLLVDATRAYWLFMFLGYGLVVSIPLIGVSSSLEVTIVLVLLERLGKAVRAPSRDTVLSLVAKDVGVGTAFGLHELLDQVGGIIGPFLVAMLMLAGNSDYRFAFGFLFIPFFALLLALVYTYRRIGHPIRDLEPKKIKETGRRLPKPFRIYVFAVLLNTIGLVPYTLILFKASVILEPAKLGWVVPLIYMLIQAVDAPAAVLSGYAFDKLGLKVLVLPFLLSLFPPLLVLASSELAVLVTASIFFGLVLGMQESVYRAAVSKLTSISSRGTAYGILNTAYGLGFMISGTMYGLLIDRSVLFVFVIPIVLFTQITATVSLLSIREKERD